MAQIPGDRRPCSRPPESKEGARTQRINAVKGGSRKTNYEASVGGMLATARRRGSIAGTMLKTLGMGKGEPVVHVSHLALNRGNLRILLYSRVLYLYQYKEVRV